MCAFAGRAPQIRGVADRQTGVLSHLRSLHVEPPCGAELAAPHHVMVEVPKPSPECVVGHLVALLKHRARHTTASWQWCCLWIGTGFDDGGAVSPAMDPPAPAASGCRFRGPSQTDLNKSSAEAIQVSTAQLGSDKPSSAMVPSCELALLQSVSYSWAPRLSAMSPPRSAPRMIWLRSASLKPLWTG